MPSKNPILIMWDSCALLGFFNQESEKVAGLTYELRECEAGRAILGLAIATLSEITRLADGSRATETLEQFLELPFVQVLNGNKEVGLLASRLGHRFDLRNHPELLTKAQASGVPTDQKRLRPKDAEILATAIVYKAPRLTTYDPLLVFIGEEFTKTENALTIGPPVSSLLFL